MKRLIPLIVLAAVVALVVALSTGGSSKNQAANAKGGGPYGGKSKPPASAATTIDVRATALGRTLVDAKGRTLYEFEADKPNVSSCSSACLSIWPPLTSAGKPQAKDGALAAKIGTTSNTSGKSQVTYSGHPLYYYVGDRKPGDTTGQGLKQFGAEWYVLTPTGNKIDHG